jgi:uncharacterized membrane protein YbaN (DUF454 family)
MNKAGKFLLMVLGSFSVALGFLGIVLPLLPTTPFLLLAAFCYARASQRAYHWLTGNRWFGVYLKNYQEGRGLTRKHKISAIALLWAGMGATTLWAVSAWWLAWLLLGIASAVTWYLLKLPTANLAIAEESG